MSQIETQESQEPLRRELARLLWRLADLVQASERRKSFRAAAYRRAIWALDELPADLDVNESELVTVPGIGPGIASLVGEFLSDGHLSQLIPLEQGYPLESAWLRRLPRMTPKLLRALSSELGVETRSDLHALLEVGGAVELPGVGPQTCQLWLDILELAPTGHAVPAHQAWMSASGLKDHIAQHTGNWVDVAGQVRRVEEWVNRIDLLIVTDDQDRLLSFLSNTASLGGWAPGTGTHAGETHSGIAVEFFVSVPEAAGTALIEATGPPGHVSRLRLDPFATEQETYESAGVPLVPAAARGLPLEEAISVVRVGDVKGDFHLHSDASPDGRMTLDEIASRAVGSGYEYILITDHTAGLRFGGLDREGILSQSAAIASLRSRYPGLVIFHGAELNIAADGSLDLDDATLSRLDFAVAGVHSHFGLDRDAQTDRILAALENRVVRVLAHPFGRRIGIRPGLNVDMERVIEACRDRYVAIESNGHRDRLDLPSEWVRIAADRGAVFAANSDAHRVGEMANVENAVATLQRAGVKPDMVVNTYTLADLRSWIARRERSETDEVVVG